MKPELFLTDLKVAARSLWRSKGLAITVIVTLALGIGANAAIFSVVRGVLLRPLNNRDEDRIIYIRQSAMGIGVDNTNFSVPEIVDIKSSVKSVAEFGDFSVIGFTMIGLGEPREVRAGVVGGTYFDVMGLHPAIGRLLDMRDDGPNAQGAAVLTYRFWKTAFNLDPTVIGKTVRLGTRSATIIGVLEPTVPYPAETEIIANVVTSPHHLSATMVQGRVHRMTELFGRLAPGATIEQARAELNTVSANMIREHPDAYSPSADTRISAVHLKEQITSGAKTVLLVLLASSLLIFVIACSNVANLILSRSVRREGELAIRAALGASHSALRRTLLAESLLMCTAGALLGILVASPMVGILAHYASRFSVRALDLTVDSSMLWVGAILAIVASILLAFVPRLPSAESSNGLGLASGSVRITGSTGRRLRVFAITQIAASFILLAGASMLIKTLVSLQSVNTGFDLHRTLAFNVPVMSYGKSSDEIINFYREVMRRIEALPGVDHVSLGTSTPWRDAGTFGPGFSFTGEGHVKGTKEEDPRANFRVVSPGYFASLGIPILEGRDFNNDDRRGGEPVVIISQSVAQRMFPGEDPINRHVMYTDPVMKFVYISMGPRRVVGVSKDVDDEHVVPGPSLTIYHPFGQIPDDNPDKEFPVFGGRLFVHTKGDPYALVNPVTQIIRNLSTDQPVERPATLEDIRAEVLTPDRLNTFVFSGFAAVALLIAIVGVGGVLAFSVSGRTREFGIRLAMGSPPSRLLTKVIAEGAFMAAIGVLAGAVGGYALAKLVGSYVMDIRMPSLIPVVVSAAVLLTAAVVASAWPASRAARIDVIEALRSD
ncbi:MAG TPA: ABC transporter permease [Candidatus Acidoferrum sp.]|jgi:predicted permease